MPTKIVEIKNSAFPAAQIDPGDFVVWKNLDPYPHTVETSGDSSYYFNVGALFTGDVSSPVLFSKEGKFDYFCRFHAGMNGQVSVGGNAGRVRAAAMDHGGHDHGQHLQHFHGFVTGGRFGRRFFMSHTPVIADQRHCYQVILQGSLTTPQHIAAYEALRKSSFGPGKVQIFHDHLSLVDIGSGTIKLLPSASFEYYPDDGANGLPVAGLEEGIPVSIDRVIHFHKFQPDSAYPDGMGYIVYGDDQDLFMDHHITAAPDFHSVAKISSVSGFWKGGPDPIEIQVPSKSVRRVDAKTIAHVSFVDNAYHLYWLLPPGAGPNQAVDPLKTRDGSSPIYDVVLPDGSKSRVEIERFLHFDIRLLNYGVLIT